MKIYTKTGDTGQTGLFGGGRVDKDDPQVAAYGTVDELNAALGAARALGVTPRIDQVLVQIQNDLFVLGAELATVAGKEQSLRLRLLESTDIARLESQIDEHEAQLAPLKQFILPGGCPGAALLHLARTICRRAERELISAGRARAARAELLIYLNRLSDLLFVLARATNAAQGVADVPWTPAP